MGCVAGWWVAVMGLPILCCWLLLPGVLAGMGEELRLARGVVVRRLLAVDQGSGSVSSLHVRVMAEAAGVTVRTVWRWLSEAREGRLEPVAGRGGAGSRWMRAVGGPGGGGWERRGVVSADDGRWAR